MKKIIIIICIYMLCILRVSFSESLDNLRDFNIYIDKHRYQMAWGGGLAISGAILTLLGGGLASYAVSIGAPHQNVNKSMTLVSGYTIMGFGLLSTIIGLPLWFFANKDYLETLNLRQQYYFLTHE